MIEILGSYKIHNENTKKHMCTYESTKWNGEVPRQRSKISSPMITNAGTLKFITIGCLIQKVCKSIIGNAVKKLFLTEHHA